MPDSSTFPRGLSIAALGYNSRPSGIRSCSLPPVPCNKSKAEILAEVLVNEAANLYKKMVKELTNETMTKAVVDSSANLLPAMIYSNEQTQNAISYRHKTQVHHG
jgi:hypothetical protein